METPKILIRDLHNHLRNLDILESRIKVVQCVAKTRGPGSRTDPMKSARVLLDGVEMTYYQMVMHLCYLYASKLNPNLARFIVLNSNIYDDLVSSEAELAKKHFVEVIKPKAKEENVWKFLKNKKRLVVSLLSLYIYARRRKPTYISMPKVEV